jgi:hypothetical protein
LSKWFWKIFLMITFAYHTYFTNSFSTIINSYIHTYTCRNIQHSYYLYYVRKFIEYYATNKFMSIFITCNGGIHMKERERKRISEQDNTIIVRKIFCERYVVSMHIDFMQNWCTNAYSNAHWDTICVSVSCGIEENCPLRLC